MGNGKQTSAFLDTSHNEIFDKEGILVLPLLSDNEVKLLLTAYQTLSHNLTGRSFHSTMFVDNADKRRKIDAVIRRIICPHIFKILNRHRLLFANFIVKENSVDTQVHIHQDWSFTLPDYNSVNVWIPLTDINQQTGTFYALKGSHTLFNNIRYTPPNDNEYADIQEIIHKYSTPYHINAGEAIFYHGSLVHFSDANTSPNQRFAVGSVFIPENAKAVHYYRPQASNNLLEVYATDEEFYCHFNFFQAPQNTVKLTEIYSYNQLPSEADLRAYYEKNI